ncbi:class E sortase [Agromyces sp. CFH 90414]|uniref:Class E sortase n=1 Tax=Agromyces agglutinans TaxID=2662258 RepID=A0A6I2F5D8_9MICO|nr:class E sortase [Agromyces agglutinans]MRG58937.1 class E sortase [Agromyces agglutinans]
MSDPLPDDRRSRRDARRAEDRREASERRPRVSVVGVFGELLLTAGALILLFLGWQLWWNDAIMAGQQSEAASELSAAWAENDRAQREPAATEDPAAAPVDPGEPIVDATEYPNGESFAVMYVPRFNAPETFDSVRNIAEGIGLDVLNSYSQGVGHYPGTAMPGAVGNFAIAAHRSAYGGGMHEIEQLQLGDAIYIQTKDGWYTYRFRDFEYVTPETVDVLSPVPHHPDLQPTDRIITLTSCNPLYSTAERIIAYGVLESWQPGAANPPAEIADAVASWEN